MSISNLIFEEIATKYVLLSGKQSINEDEYFNFDGDQVESSPLFYGIGWSGTHLDVFCDAVLDKNTINKTLGYFAKYTKISINRTTPFKSYILPGHPIKHNALNGYGTFGGIGIESNSNKIVIVSNNHVIANSNLANINDLILNYQNNAQIGKLFRFVPLSMPPFRNNTDVAIALLKKGVVDDSLIRRQNVMHPRIGMRVYKDGATTGRTYGEIVSLNATIIVGNPVLGNLNFIQNIVIRSIDKNPFSLPGDSGSFIRSTSKSNSIVGLLYAGNDDGSYTFANTIENVVRNIGVYF